MRTIGKARFFSSSFVLSHPIGSLAFPMHFFIRTPRTAFANSLKTKQFSRSLIFIAPPFTQSLNDREREIELVYQIKYYNHISIYERDRSDPLFKLITQAKFDKQLKAFRINELAKDVLVVLISMNDANFRGFQDHGYNCFWIIAKIEAVSQRKAIADSRMRTIVGSLVWNNTRTIAGACRRESTIADNSGRSNVPHGAYRTTERQKKKPES